MKLNLLITILLVVLASFSVTGQIKFNGDFENPDSKAVLPGEWDNYIGNDYLFKLDSTVTKKGRTSLSITSKSNKVQFGAASCVMPQIFKGSKLQLKGFIKTEAVTGFAGFYIGVDGTGEFNNMEDQHVNGTTEWKEYTINLPYNAEKAEQINIGAMLAGTGKAWFDDVRIYLDGKPIEQATIVSNGIKAKADKDFQSSSGISSINNDEQTVKNLALLAQVWGFIKYHLPAVANGDFNMDAELFRVMPAVLKATNNLEANSAMEQWLDKLGTPPACSNCKPKIKGKIVLEPDYGDLFNGSVVSKSLMAKLKFILDNSNISKSYYIEMGNTGNPVFRNEIDYFPTIYNDAGFRLLCLFRYWNMIEYFAPYRDITGHNWNDVLKESIPRFVAAKTEMEYDLVTIELIAKLNDTHANIWNNNSGINQFRGTLAPPFRAAFVEDKLVVTGFYGDTLQVKNNFKIGDVIQSINGIPVEQHIKKHLPYTAGSNYPTQLRDLAFIILRSNEPASKYQVVRNGNAISITQENLPRNKINYSVLNPFKDGEPGYKLINDRLGYLYPGAYHNKDLPAIKAMFANTKGLIIDMRCYPSEFMPYTFVPYVKKRRNDFVKFTFGSINRPGTFTMGDGLVGPAQGQYKGKVIVIVNEVTQSQAEFTTMALQSSPNVTVIGSTTAGADGDVSPITLPGGISTMISGIGVFYPDGTPTQRIGVKIDMIVKPTIAGIKAGRDELLEKAIELALKQ